MTSRSHRLWLLIEARPTSWAQIREAEGYLERSGIEPELNSRLTKTTGRPRRSDLHGFLIANYINAFQPSHRVYITAIASVLTGFDGEQRAHLGLVGWDDALAYDRAQRLLADVISALNPDDRGVIGNNVGLLDAPFQEIANSIGRSTIPQDLLIGTSVAIDGTAVESCGRLRVRRPALALDGYPGPSEEESDLRSLPPATVDLPRGPDGRTIYSADPDARGGHRSATSQHSAGPYNGYEMHLAVQTRDVIIQNPVDGAVLGPEVPQLILGFVLTEANAHRPRVCRYLLESVGRYRPTDDVIADRGMTMNPDEWQLPLREKGYRCHFDLMDYQRGVSPSGRALQLGVLT